MCNFDAYFLFDHKSEHIYYIEYNIRFYYIYHTYIQVNQLHAVSCTQRCGQREPSVKTLCSPLSAEFWRHCVLSKTQRRALPRHQREEMEI